jgi:serine/threonine protein kinase
LIYSVANLENILLDSNGNCKLSNFRYTLDFIIYSTPMYKRGNQQDGTIFPSKSQKDEYSAPEILKNPGSIEYSFDFWRLGIMAYKMLSGKFPFSDKDKIISEKPDLDSLQISTEAKDFIAELLIKEKFERLGSKQNKKEVKEHEFFNEINWHQLENGQIIPPFKPSVVSILKFLDF